MDQWVHVARVISKKAEKLYVNGELVAARETGGPVQPFEHELMIGNSDMFGSPGNETTAFRGSIDEIRIWSKPRTQKQIVSTMNRYLRGNERGLVGYFPLEDRTGQYIHDYSGHLMAGNLGATYQADDRDPAWAEGVKLKGRKPILRTKR
jgi:hypothetical protein